MAYDSLMVFTGNANPRLAADVVKRLNISLGRANVSVFSDGEVNVEMCSIGREPISIGKRDDCDRHVVDASLSDEFVAHGDDVLLAR